jgi:uncharacterized protein YndB with AHSA1/START domain
MINVTQQISSVRREVGRRVLEAGEARTVTISQTYGVTADDLWDACTNPERIPRWFLPITGELRLGGHYQLEGNAGGTIERCDPPRGFAATWEFGGKVTWIEVRLEPEAASATRLEIEHIALAEDDHWTQFGPGAVGIGWDLGLIGLARHLSGEGSVAREEATQWMASDEGREFIERSSDGWRTADIAAGADPGQAEAAAGRTTAFYTGAGAS